MSSEDVIVKCNQCGGQAKAGEFVLDADYKMMVCPNCIRQKNMPKKPQVEANGQVKEPKPKDWDADDEIIAKQFAKKQATQKPQLKEGMKLKCKKCDYVFVYKNQRVCPYCNKEF
jgi:hypothetical protein